MMYQLPSSRPGELVPIPTDLRDSLSCLDIVWSDMFETEDINPDKARHQEANFLKGAPPKWLNFYTKENLALVERDGFNDLKQMIEKRRKKSCLVADVSLSYEPGSGGSTLAMQVLWDFRRDFRCSRVIDSDLDTKELSKQVLELFLLSHEGHSRQDRKTVLLLLDTKEKSDNDPPIKNALLENLTEEIQKRGINTKTPVVIVLNCRPADFSLKDTLILTSDGEISQFKEKLLQQIRLQRKSQRKVKTTKLLYHKDRKESVWQTLNALSQEFTCETLPKLSKTWTADTKDELKREIENTTDERLQKYGNHKNTVLLLLDHYDDQSLNCLFKTLQEKQKRANRPAFIVINAVRKSAVRVPVDVKLKMELLADEKERFVQKMLEVRKKYKKTSQNFHGFNIMVGNFKKEDVEKVITEEMVKQFENPKESKGSALLSFLALINSYVPGSHLLKPFCKKFITQNQWSSDEGKASLEIIMKPFENLIVTFSEEEQKADCIRLAHPLIAEACLKKFTEHNVTRSQITLDFLENIVKGKETHYVQICKSLLITRQENLKEKDKFSKLILDLLDESEDNTNQCIRFLKLASKLFLTDPFYPQALARLYYIRVKAEDKYDKAENWAKTAIERDPEKSHIRDTLGQIHKNHLRNESIKTQTDIQECLEITKSAIKAFKDEEEAAEIESEDDTKFNNRGLFGFLQVCNVFFDLSSQKAFEQERNLFKSKHKADVQLRCGFFEWYLAYSRPNMKTDEPDYIREDVDECYKKYCTQSIQTEEEIKMRSFEGLLNFLESNNSLLTNHQDDETKAVPYILRNIILSQSSELKETKKLQKRLHKLWLKGMQGRSPEFYLLILLLFWPDGAEGITNPPDLKKCVQYMDQSYKEKYQRYLRFRYLVPLFFLGKGAGLQKLIHNSKLHQTDLELLNEGDGDVEVDSLQRIKGMVENHQVFALEDGHKIPVEAHDRACVIRQGHVSFYLGFTIRGPVAFNIRYHDLTMDYLNDVIKQWKVC